MRERGWRLAYPGTVVEFGGVDFVGDPFQRNVGRVGVEAYEVSATDLTTENTPRPRTDGVRFGQDYRGGVTHTFTLRARGRTREQAEQLMGAVATAWRGDAVRGTPDAFAELTTLQGGVERTMLGRPRLFTPNYDRLAAHEITAVVTFETTDDTWLGPEEQLRIDLRAVSLDGFTMPFTFPLVMSQPSQRAGQIVVGGTLPTPLVVEVHGPISNPVVACLGDWSLQLRTSLGAGRVVTLDARAWRRTITDQAGASYAGALARPGRLSSMVVRPGARQIVLSGQDTSGTAHAVVRWRPLFAGRK